MRGFAQPGAAVREDRTGTLILSGGMRVIRTPEWHEMRITSLRAMVAIRPTRKNRRKLKLAIRRASVRT